MNNSELNKIDDKAIIIRGSVLARTIEVESLIDQYLSCYFCEDNSKSNQLKELVLCSDRLSFGTKIDILISILKSNESFISSNPDFVKKLTNLLKHRNVFAHSDLKLDETTSTSEFILERYKGGKLQKETYDDNSVKSIIKSTFYISYRLISLIKQIVLKNTNLAP